MKKVTKFLIWTLIVVGIFLVVCAILAIAVAFLSYVFTGNVIFMTGDGSRLAALAFGGAFWLGLSLGGLALHKEIFGR